MAVLVTKVRVLVLVLVVLVFRVQAVVLAVLVLVLLGPKAVERMVRTRGARARAPDLARESFKDTARGAASGDTLKDSVPTASSSGPALSASSSSSSRATSSSRMAVKAIKEEMMGGAIGGVRMERELRKWCCPWRPTRRSQPLR